MTSYKKYSNVSYSDDGSTMTYEVGCAWRPCSSCVFTFDNCCPICNAKVNSDSRFTSEVRCKCGATLTACSMSDVAGAHRTIIRRCTIHTGLIGTDEDII